MIVEATWWYFYTHSLCPSTINEYEESRWRKAKAIKAPFEDELCVSSLLGDVGSPNGWVTTNAKLNDVSTTTVQEISMLTGDFWSSSVRWPASFRSSPFRMSPIFTTVISACKKISAAAICHRNCSRFGHTCRNLATRQNNNPIKVKRDFGSHR